MRMTQEEHRKLVEKEYLGAPECFRQEFRDSINKRVVVKGMWPTEALLAGGGGIYRVKADPKNWEKGANPMMVMKAQCSSPDESKIEIDFQNAYQFSGGEVKSNGLSYEK